MTRQTDILDLVNDIKAKGEPFAIATVVRTVSVHGLKLGGVLYSSPDLARLVGLQVVVHRDGPDRLAVYGGRPLAVVARCFRTESSRTLSDTPTATTGACK